MEKFDVKPEVGESVGWWYRGTIVALLALFLAQGFWFISQKSQTFDEAVHLYAGYSYWATGDFRLNREHPPLTKLLAALPVYVWYRLPFKHEDYQGRSLRQKAREFLYERTPPTPTADEILSLARGCNLLLGAVLVALVGRWSYRLWGKGACLLAMALAVLEPNLIAHSAVATTDVGLALFTFLALYLCWEYSVLPSYRLLIAAGASTGLALASKFSAVLLVGILPMVTLGFVLSGGSFALPGPSSRHRINAAWRLLEASFVVAIIVYLGGLMLWPVYFFQDITTWWEGFRWQLQHQGHGHAAFFMGDYSNFGWPHYFPVAVLIKTPIGTLVLITVSLVLWRRGKTFGRREVFFLLAPIALILAAMTQVKVNIGLRYILPVYPLLFVVASRTVTIRLSRKLLVPAGIGGLVAITAFSSFRTAPHYLAYFNELVGGPRQGLRYLSDSNIDWGQDLKGLKAFMQREQLPMIYLSYFGDAPPEHYRIRYQHLPGFGHFDASPLGVLPEDTKREVLAISVFHLQGVPFADKTLYRWLQSRTPIGTIGYSMYTYDITGDAEAHLRLAEAYIQQGPQQLAIPELRKVLALEPAHPKADALLRQLGGTGLH